MAHKIAILINKSIYFNYGDDYTKILESITEWETVSDEEYDMLMKASYRKDFVVLEQPANTSAFVRKTISDFIEEERQEKAKEEAAKKKREEAAARKKLLKEARSRAEKVLLLATLKKELGEE